MVLLLKTRLYSSWASCTFKSSKSKSTLITLCSKSKSTPTSLARFNKDELKRSIRRFLDSLNRAIQTREEICRLLLHSFLSASKKKSLRKRSSNPKEEGVLNLHIWSASIMREYKLNCWGIRFCFVKVMKSLKWPIFARDSNIAKKSPSLSIDLYCGSWKVDWNLFHISYAWSGFSFVQRPIMTCPIASLVGTSWKSWR